MDCAILVHINQRRRLMNLNQLYYFVTLAHMEHYTRAAEKLCITQPSLSHAISSLEQELDIFLFEKQGRNVVLTKYGKLFLEYAEEALGILEAGIKKTKAMTSAISGRIDLGYIYTQGIEFIPQVVEGFLSENPEKKIQFGFNNGVTEEVIKGIKEERFDVGFCSKMEQEPQLEFFPVYQEKLVLAVPNGHPLEEKPFVTFEELASFPQVFFNKGSGLRKVVDCMFAHAKLEPNITYTVDEDSAMVGLVAKGFGVGIVPDVPTIRSVAVTLLPIEGLNYERYIYMVTIRNKYQSPVVKEFIKYIREHYRIKELK